jgi:hypothetical protein
MSVAKNCWVDIYILEGKYNIYVTYLVSNVCFPTVIRWLRYSENVPYLEQKHGF